MGANIANERPAHSRRSCAWSCYLSTNLVQTIDNHDIRSTNTVSLTPGLRTHLGQNWYFLGAVEVPVAHVKPFDYQVLGAIMKVF